MNLFEELNKLNEGVEVSDLSAIEKQKLDLYIRDTIKEELDKASEDLKSIVDHVVDKVAKSFDLEPNDANSQYVLGKLQHLNRLVESIVNEIKNDKIDESVKITEVKGEQDVRQDKELDNGNTSTDRLDEGMHSDEKRSEKNEETVKQTIKEGAEEQTFIVHFKDGSIVDRIKAKDDTEAWDKFNDKHLGMNPDNYYVDTLDEDKDEDFVKKYIGKTVILPKRFNHEFGLDENENCEVLLNGYSGDKSYVYCFCEETKQTIGIPVKEINRALNLTEGRLRSWVADKVSKFVTKQQAIKTVDEFTATLESEFGDTYNIKQTKDGIVISPKSGILCKVNVKPTKEGAILSGIQTADGDIVNVGTLEDANNLVATMIDISNPKLATEELKEEFIDVNKETLVDLDKDLDAAGFNIVSKKDYKSYGDKLAVHYQIITKEGNKGSADAELYANKLSTLLDEFGDKTGQWATYSLGLQDDGFISAGFDVRPTWYEPGKDIASTKPTMIRLKDGEPYGDESKAVIKDIADHMGMSDEEVKAAIPSDKKREGLKEEMKPAQLPDEDSIEKDIPDVDALEQELKKAHLDEGAKEDRKRLGYLWRKEKVSNLDKDEMIELQSLIQKYGRPDKQFTEATENKYYIFDIYGGYNKQEKLASDIEVWAPNIKQAEEEAIHEFKQEYNYIDDGFGLKAVITYGGGKKKVEEALGPNKLFIDLYSTGEGDWNKYYDEHDTMYVILKDAKIFCKGKRDELLDKYNMFSGTFLQTYPQRTAEEVESKAQEMIKEIGAREVTPEEFIKIEEEGQKERTATAFAEFETRKANEDLKESTKEISVDEHKFNKAIDLDEADNLTDILNGMEKTYNVSIELKSDIIPHKYIIKGDETNVWNCLHALGLQWSTNESKDAKSRVKNPYKIGRRYGKLDRQQGGDIDDADEALFNASHDEFGDDEWTSEDEQEFLKGFDDGFRGVKESVEGEWTEEKEAEMKAAFMKHRDEVIAEHGKELGLPEEQINKSEEKVMNEAEEDKRFEFNVWYYEDDDEMLHPGQPDRNPDDVKVIIAKDLKSAELQLDNDSSINCYELKEKLNETVMFLPDDVKNAIREYVAQRGDEVLKARNVTDLDKATDDEITNIFWDIRNILKKEGIKEGPFVALFNLDEPVGFNEH